ncbi:TPA: SMC family ATPase [Candidatus Woesearchaeota archaeon]|nr:SMC family ATPase [Candidatus Woesearchaeota archaeon]
MQIKRLRLRNIRSYSSQEIEFPSGSVLLAGDIGSGKSSILHAVEFALFGTRRDGLSGDALLRKGENQGEVELSMSVAGKEVVIRRGLRRGKDTVAQESGYLMIDGTRHDLTPVEMKAKILSLLGYPKELLTKSKSLIYRYTVYTPQEEMKQILFDSADSRVDTLRKVFGIDKYKRIVENAQIYAKKARDEKRVLEGTVHDLPLKQKEKETREEEVTGLEKNRREMREKTETMRQRKKKKEEELAETEEKVKELGQIRKNIELLDTKLKEVVRQRAKDVDEMTIMKEQAARLKERLEGVKVEEKEHPAASEVEKNIKSKEERLQRMMTKKTELIERKNNLVQRAEEVKQELSSKGKSGGEEKKQEMIRLLEELKDKEMIAGSLAETEKTIKEIDERVTELKTKQSQSRALKEKITQLDQCPTCGQEVKTEYKTGIKQREDERITKYGSELAEILTKKAKVIGALEEYRQRLERMTEQEKKISAMKVEVENLDKVKEEVARLEKMRETLDRQKIGLMKELEEMDDAVIEELRGEIETQKRLLKEIHEHKMKLQEMLHVQQMLVDKERKYDELGLQVEELKQRVKDINQEKMTLNADAEKLKDAEERHQTVRKELETIAAEEKRYEIRLGEMGKEIEGMQKMINMLTKEIEEKKKAIGRITRLGEIDEWIENMFVNLMATMERHIMTQIHQQFNELFTQWFDLLIDDENLSVRLDDSFCPVVVQNGYESLVDHLSGGEKTSIALAYRLALNKVVNDIVQEIKTKDLIILDEPTDGFSSEQLDKVRAVLDELNMKQVVIVSHESKIESFVDKVIRVNKHEHVSRVVG